MKKSKISILFLVLVMILAISAVNAADTNDYSDSGIQASEGADIDNLTSSEVDDVASTDSTDALSTGGNNFADLQDAIDNPQTPGKVVLNSNFTRVGSENAIVIDDSIEIDGNGFTIDGNNNGRIFEIKQGAVVILQNVILINGNAENGGAIYVNSGATLNVEDVLFSDNTAVYRGGAIWSDGTVDIKNSAFDSNNITYRKENKDYGGAAIYNGGTLTVDNTRFTNDLTHYVVRTGDSNNPQLIDAVVLSSGSAIINNSYFENNSGSYGGAITAIPILGSTFTSLIVENSQFVNNLAYCGAAIYAGGGSTQFNIKNCTFVGNNATGIGSYGYTSAGAAICLTWGAEGTITESKFINNSATVGGAVDVSATKNPETVKVIIDDCLFENNTATGSPSRKAIGGAIRINTNHINVTVEDSEFINNVAVEGGNAIYNKGDLTLSGNTLSSGGADICNNGTIESTIYSVVLNGTQITSGSAVKLFATLVDDNGNLINDTNLFFTITGQSNVKATYNPLTKLYEANTVITTPGVYGVSILSSLSSNLDITDGSVLITGSFSELQALIDAANAGDVINLPHDIAYDPAFDSSLINGILVNKTITINGNGFDISGSGLARIFNVINNYALTLNDAVVCNGNAENGGAIYVNSGATLNVEDVLFSDNTAKYRGGAIWSDGTVDIKNSAFDSNNITYRKENKDYGGAAIYNGGTLTVDNTRFTNDLTHYVVRTGDSNNPQLIDAVVLTSGSAIINNSYFENNSGSYGGAISATPILGSSLASLIVENSQFVNNLAYCGAAIYAGSGPTKLSVANCTFKNNNAAGIGTYGYTSAGGAISLVRGVEANITGSKFINNTAPNGGAIDTAPTAKIPNTVSLAIDGCEFINNTATDKGGAIRSSNNRVNVSVENSQFINNTATKGSAVYTEGNLSLSNNDIEGDGVAIVSTTGNINSHVTVVISTEKTNYHLEPITLTATLVDDNNNPINYTNFKFVFVSPVGLNSIAATINDEGKYVATFTPTNIGQYNVTTNYDADDVTNAMFTVYKSLIDLKTLIDADTTGTITLDSDYAYNAEFDSGLVNGIPINKNIIIDGNGVTLSGGNAIRLFNVASGYTLTLNNITVRDAIAAKGAGVYVESGATLNANDVNFINNTAATRGAGIYSEGTVNVDKCVFDSNDNTVRNRNDENGGAAIYNFEGSLTVNNSVFKNNFKNIVLRGTGGTNGDVIDGVVVSCGETKIFNSVFDNNSGCYGGALTVMVVDTNVPSLILDNCNFTNNVAYAGGAIYLGVGEVPYTITNCLFENNLATGYGTQGYTAAGGSLLIMWDSLPGLVENCTFKNNNAKDGVSPGGSAIAAQSASPIINNCTFENNYASASGAAVSISKHKNNNILPNAQITNSTFKNNTADENGGAIFIDGYSTVSVKDSNFTDNKANGLGNAINSKGTLTLSGNTILSNGADIYNNGTIESTVYSVVLNGTQHTSASDVKLFATLVDDNGNLINDTNLFFTITGQSNVKATYNPLTKLYEASIVITTPGVYDVSILSSLDSNLDVTNGSVLITYGTFSELQALIDAANAGDVINLTHDIAYDSAFDSGLINGIVVNKTITIKANGFDISGSGLARVFNVTNNAALTLNDVSVSDGNAENGGAIYVNSGASLNADNVLFSDNSATYRGGAIFSDGTVDIKNSAFDSNNITYRKENDDNGGAAIYNGGTLTVNNTRFTNDLTHYVVRYGDANNPHLIDGVVLTSGIALINNSYFENNSGTYGGAITAIPILGSTFTSLIVENSQFVNNLAYCGAAIYAGGGPTQFSIKNCTFTGNNATGIGSKGYTSAGGAVCLTRGSDGTISDSKFINNTATVGGAIDASSSLASETLKFTVDNCIFENNTAVGSPTRKAIGGAIRVNTKGIEVTVKDSQFTNNVANDGGSAVYNVGELSLSGNKIFSDKAEILSTGNVTSKINVVILEGSSIEGEYGVALTVTANVTDDNDNIINCNEIIFVFNGINPIAATYNPDTKLYEAVYTPDTTGNITVSIDETNLDADITTGTIVVENLNATLLVYADDIVEGEDAIIIVSLIGPDSGLNGTVKVVVDDVEYTVNVVNGDGNLTIENLIANSYPVIAIFNSNPIFNVAYSESVFYVKVPTILTVDPIADVEYGEEIDVTIHLTDNNGIGLTRTVVIEGAYNVLIENGVGVFTIDIQPEVGSYDFNVVYDGDVYFNGSSATFGFNVIPKVVNQDDVEYSFKGDYNDGLNITIKSPVDAKYTVDIEGYIFEIDVVDGTGSILIDIPRGAYDAIISIKDGNFSLTPISDVFEYKSVPEYDVVINGTYPTALVTITGTPGNYTVYIDDEHEVNISFTGTHGSGVINGLNGGTYTAIVSYLANNDYYGDYKDVNFTIDKSIAYLSIFADNILKGQNATIIAFLTDSNYNKISGKVKIIIPGIGENEIDVVDGEGNVTISGLPVGYYSVSGIFENNNYNVDQDADTFFVRDITTLTVDPIADVQYGEPIEVNIHLIDSEGIGLTGVVVIGGTYNVLIENGVGVFTIDIQPDVGHYNLTAVYGGNTYYNISSAEFEFNVIPKVVDSEYVQYSFTGDYDNGLNVTIKSPVDATYTVNIEGTIVEIDVVDGVGSKVVYNLAPGTHDFNITINDTNYLMDTIEDHLDYKSVPEYDVVIDGTYPTALVTITGTPGNYTVYVDSEHSVDISFTGTQGIGVITGLNAGNYTATVSFEENETYKGTYKDVNFTIAKSSAFLFIFADNILKGQNATITAYLTDSNYNKISGKVKIIIPGIGDNEIDVVDGEGNVTISGLPVGYYSVSGIFENNNYNVDQDADSFFVKDITTLTVDPIADVQYGEPIEVNIHLIDSEGIGLTGVVVIGGTYNVLIENGVGVFTIDIQPDVGHYNLTAVYGGNTYYNISSAEFEFNVIPKFVDSERVQYSYTGDYDNGLNITIKSPVDAVYTVNIEGTIVEIDVVNGVGSKIVNNLAAGTYDFNITINDTNYLMDAIEDHLDYKYAPEFNVMIGGIYPGAIVFISGTSGNYTVRVDDEHIIDISVNTMGIGAITGLNAGNYTATVSFNGNETYKGTYKDVNFTVSKATPKITVEALNGWYGNDARVTVNISSGATGNVTVIVNGKEYSAKIEGNTSVLTVEADDLLYGVNNVVVIYDGDNNYNSNHNSTTFEMLGQYVTNDTFYTYFDENGVLRSEVPFDQLFFVGDFEGLSKIITINKPITIYGQNAILFDIALDIKSDDVTIIDLRFAADNVNFTANNGALIHVEGNNVDLMKIYASYDAPSDADAFVIFVDSADEFSLTSSEIVFNGNVDNYNYQYGLKVVDSNMVFISDNAFNLCLPARTPDWYGYGIYQDFVLGMGIQGGSNVEISQNNITNIVIGQTSYTTLDTIMVYGTTDLNINHNNIELIDVDDTPASGVAYYQAVDLYTFTGIVEYNNIVVNTTLGLPGSGTAYAIQLSGPYTATVAYNNLTAIANGPASGILSYNWGGFANLTAEFNKIGVAGSGNPGGLGAVLSGIELQVNIAKIYNNTIYAQSVSGYDENDNVFAISSYQSSNVDKLDIQGNYIVFDGNYAVYINKANVSVVSNNFLAAHNIYGNKAVYIGANVTQATVSNNLPTSELILVVNNDSWIGIDHVVDVYVPNAVGSVTININGIEREVELVDGIATYTIPVEELVPGINNISATYSGISFDKLSDNTTLLLAVKDLELFIYGSNITVGSPEVIYVFTNKAFAGYLTVVINGEHPVEIINGTGILVLNDLPASVYTATVSYDGKLFIKDEDSTTFKVSKHDTIITVTAGEVVIDKDLEVSISVPGLTGDVLVTGDVYEGIVSLTNGTGKFTIPKAKMTDGLHTIVVGVINNPEFADNSTIYTFYVEKAENYTFDVNLTIDEITAGENIAFDVTLPADANGTLVVYVDDEIAATVNPVDGVASVDIPASKLPAGDHTVTVVYSDDKYGVKTFSKDVSVDKLSSKLSASAVDIVIGQNAIVSVVLPTYTDGSVYVELLGKYYDVTIVNGRGTASISDLAEGTYKALVTFAYDSVYENNVTYVTFKVSKVVYPASEVIDVTTPVNATAPIVTITLPSDATGYLLLDVDGNQTFVPLVKGTASVTVPEFIVPGNYTAVITYTGDNKYAPITTTTNITVASNVPDSAFTIPETSETNSPTFSINLPNATGLLMVDVDGNSYVALLVNGSASITVPGLSEGNHNVTVYYSGDEKYTSVIKSTNLTVKPAPAPVYKITNNKDISVLYTGSASYKVLVMKDGKAAGAGESVTIAFNGASQTVKTDASGYATLRLNTNVNIGSYPIKATCNGVSVSNKVTVSHVVSIKNTKVKKSKKVTKIKLTLKKVDGKVLRGKTLKISFNGKTYKVKTNKKGTATWKVKKSMVKKLKVGKKYKYKVTYGKDFVTKKITIKK